MKADQGVEWEPNGGVSIPSKISINLFVKQKSFYILKKEKKEFLGAMRLRSIITKYSDYILRPIVMKNNY